MDSPSALATLKTTLRPDLSRPGMANTYPLKVILAIDFINVHKKTVHVRLLQKNMEKSCINRMAFVERLEKKKCPAESDQRPETTMRSLLSKVSYSYLHLVTLNEDDMSPFLVRYLNYSLATVH